MPRLLVDRLHCIEDTPELTADEVYLIVACARPGRSGEVRVLNFAGADWRSLAEGTHRDTDVVIDSAWSSDKVYVGLLLEQDGRRDLAHEEVRASLEQQLGEVVQMFASVRGASPPEVAEQLRREVDRLVSQLADDDEPIGTATILQMSPAGSGVSFVFHSPKGRYRLDLKLS